MGGRGVIVAGLLAGVLAGGALLAVAVILLPPPAPPGLPGSSAEAPSPSPTSVAQTPTAPTPVATTEPETGFHVGKPAPPLRIPQLGGGEIDLESLRGTPVWVNFMATWCPPCRDEIPRMNALSVRYADAGLVVIAVDVREDEGTVAGFARDLPILFPVGLDTDGAAQQTWGAFALPVHFWIDAQGIVRDGALGGIGPDIMAAGLESILPGVDVEP
jgi:cytochrome c biogenesis protein CcmG, thiol:disulfide interchange protein DsbE